MRAGKVPKVAGITDIPHVSVIMIALVNDVFVNGNIGGSVIQIPCS